MGVFSFPTFERTSRCFSVIVLLCIAASLQADELRDRYRELQRRLRAHADVQLPGTEANRYFLPGEQIQASSAKDRKIFNAYAEAIIRLAKKAARTDPTWAYALLHEAAYFGEDNLADKVVVSNAVPPKTRQASSNHPRLGWKRKSYFRIASPHYQVVTREEQAGIAIANRLEMLYAVWRQLFFEYWCDGTKLLSAMENGKKLSPSARLYRVVLFEDRNAYTKFLQKEQPRIGITRGFYDIVAHTSYFFPSDDETTATQLHEATHQLFQEVGRATERLGLEQNFWVVEGIAMYMESLQKHDGVAIVGGPGARRLQFARYRCLREDYYIPLRDLVGYGREKLQLDPAIRQIYSQSAGLVHFLMDAGERQYRDGLIRYLKSIYKGRDRIETLSEAVETSFAVLDQRYAAFLQLRDDELIEAAIPKNHLRSLCLSGTSVTSRGLQSLSKQENLEWLDIAGLEVDEQSLQFIVDSQKLKQVSFDQCRKISDNVFELLDGNRQMDELDVSGTQITDVGLKKLTGHPSLETLWITNTAVTDASIPTLVSLKSLRVLACGGSRISGKGLQTLKRNRPDLQIAE